MYFKIPEAFIRNRRELFALMVATVSSIHVIQQQIDTTNLTISEMQEFLAKKGFIKVVPDKPTTLQELINKLDIASTAFVKLANNKYIGIVANTYYYTENLDSIKVAEYYLNTEYGHNLKYKCIKCGNCCRVYGSNGGVIFSEEDINKIEQNTPYTIRDKVVLVSNKSNKKLYHLSLKNNQCEFLDKDNSCKLINTLSVNCQLPVICYLFRAGRGAGINFFSCPGIGLPDGDNWDILDVFNWIDKYCKEYQ